MAVVSLFIYVSICIGVTVFATMITNTNPLVALCAFLMGVLLVIGAAFTAESNSETEVTRVKAEPVNNIFVNTQSKNGIKELEQPEPHSVVLYK